MTTLLELENVGKIFDDGTAALREVSMKVRPGEFVVVLGPSGAGKTISMVLSAAPQAQFVWTVRPSMKATFVDIGSESV